MRDAIAWASFCRTVVHAGHLSAWAAYVHGAYLTLLDGLGLGLGIPEATARQLRAACELFLHTQLPLSEHESMLSASFKHLPSELGRNDGAGDPTTHSFGAGAFRIPKVRSSSFAHASDSVIPSVQSALSGLRTKPTCAMTTEMNELQLTCRHTLVRRLSVKRYFIIGNLSEALTRQSHTRPRFCFLLHQSAPGFVWQEAA